VPEKKFVALANNETYAYLEQGEGETVLLLHGNLSSSLHFLPLFSRMKKVRLVAPDMRGFGDSTYNAHFSNLSELAEDVKLFAGTLGISRAHVIGWSTGGGVALELAAKYPDFVQSLFIIEGIGYRGFPILKYNPDGTQVPYTSREELGVFPGVKSIVTALEAQSPSLMNLIWNSSIYTGKKPPKKDNNLYIAESLKQRNVLDTYWALVTFNMSNEDNGYGMGSGTIGNIRCPVTFTCGELDKVIPPAIIRENAAAISGSKLLEYKKCGHSPMVDCPDRLAADIAAHMAMARHGN